MTMTAEEREVLTQWAKRTTACGTLHEAIKMLARVALKDDAIKQATAKPPSPGGKEGGV